MAHNTMDMVTLGMFIIDEIHFPEGKSSQYDILGGAGSWAVVGARLFRPSPTSQRVGWTVHRGSDFPGSVEDELKSWRTSCNLVDTPHRLTTRGWNRYGAHEERAFKYTTEKLRIDETHLSDAMLLAKCFHLICTPTRCVNLVTGILRRRAEFLSKLPNRDIQYPEPLFIWEPVPDSMGPDELENLYLALQHVHVVSPNHQELAALFASASQGTQVLDDQQDHAPKTMEEQCATFLERGFQGRSGAVVVRCGQRGCYVATASSRFMLPAFFKDASKVVDPTGAGNAFLGGLCIGLVEPPSVSLEEYSIRSWHGKDVAFIQGAVYGSVAASFAVEQVGLPKVREVEGGLELWNGESVEKRLQSYLATIIKAQ